MWGFTACFDVIRTEKTTHLSTFGERESAFVFRSWIQEVRLYSFPVTVSPLFFSIPLRAHHLETPSMRLTAQFTDEGHQAATLESIRRVCCENCIHTENDKD